MTMSKIQEVYETVEKGKVKAIQGLVQEALDAGDAPLDILNKGMIAAMDSVGAKFKAGEIFVPEMLVAAKCMKKGVEILKPHLASGETGADTGSISAPVCPPAPVCHFLLSVLFSGRKFKSFPEQLRYQSAASVKSNSWNPVRVISCTLSDTA